MKISPTEYDLIVLGTGLEESIIAAAASTSGLTVLHLDNEPEYGSQWAGLDAESFLARLSKSNADKEAASPGSVEGMEFSAGADVPEVSVGYHVGNIYRDVEIRQQPAEASELRQLAIDLAPKLLYTTGPFVDSLLRFKAENYIVFRLIKSFVWQGGKLISVPASRADIFRSDHLSPTSKRSLMRFLKNTMDAIDSKGPLKEPFLRNCPSQEELLSCISGESMAPCQKEEDSFGEDSFVALLDREKLPPDLQAVLLYCLAMLLADQGSHTARVREATGTEEALPQDNLNNASHCKDVVELPSARGLEEGSSTSPPQCTAHEALERMAQYIEAASSHGSPFMAADYGSGELPQAFCRVAAVAGAVYALRAGVSTLLLDPGTQCCKGVRLKNGQVLKCKALATNSTYLPPLLAHADASQKLNRAVLITQQPLRGFAAGSDPDQCIAIVAPSALAPGLPACPVRVLQLGARSMVAPEGRYLVYITSTSNGTKSSKQLEPVVKALLPSDDCLVMSTYYTQSQKVTAMPSLPRNVALCQPPDAEIGFERALKQAEAAYRSLYDERAFLPSVQLPEEDPDDIDLGA